MVKTTYEIRTIYKDGKFVEASLTINGNPYTRGEDKVDDMIVAAIRPSAVDRLMARTLEEGNLELKFTIDKS